MIPRGRSRWEYWGIVGHRFLLIMAETRDTLIFWLEKGGLATPSVRHMTVVCACPYQDKGQFYWLVGNYLSSSTMRYPYVNKQPDNQPFHRQF